MRVGLFGLRTFLSVFPQYSRAREAFDPPSFNQFDQYLGFKSRNVLQKSQNPEGVRHAKEMRVVLAQIQRVMLNITQGLIVSRCTV
jgi:hypothetical protein